MRCQEGQYRMLFHLFEGTHEKYLFMIAWGESERPYHSLYSIMEFEIQSHFVANQALESKRLALDKSLIEVIQPYHSLLHLSGYKIKLPRELL